MRATVMYGAGDVRIENVADPEIVEPAGADGERDAEKPENDGHVDLLSCW